MIDVPLLNEANLDELLVAGSTGCLPRSTSFGNLPCAAPFHEAIPLIPRSEWPARIKEKDAQKTWLEDLCRSNAIPCLDQNGLNYCHAYGTGTSMMVAEWIQTGRLWMPAPESIGGPVTGWRNQGAALDDDLAQVARAGCCSASMLDTPYSLNPNAWNPTWKQDALAHTVPEWFDVDLPGKVFDAITTACFADILCVVAFGWWRHAISGPYRVIDLGQHRYRLRYRNNWGMRWNNGGWIDMDEGKGTPDWGAFAPRSVGPKP